MTYSQNSFHTAVALLVVASAISVPARADVISDPTNDFLATYVGPQNGDLDVVSAEVSYDGTSFRFHSTSAGNIGFTAGGFFVWGVNRGAGTARFGALASNVLFDSVVILTPGGASSVRDLVTSVSTPLDASAVSFSGDTLVATVAASLLPTQGFAIENYTVNLWPRLAGGTNMISDFAPNNSNSPLTVTPEPSAFILLATAVPVLAALRRFKGTAK